MSFLGTGASPRLHVAFSCLTSFVPFTLERVLGLSAWQKAIFYFLECLSIGCLTFPCPAAWAVCPRLECGTGRRVLLGLLHPEAQAPVCPALTFFVPL